MKGNKKTHNPLTSSRVSKTINRNWKFCYSPNEESKLQFSKADCDDSSWRAIAIPHTWSTFETTNEMHPFIRSPAETDDSYWWYGWGWYRKRFWIETKYRNGKVFLEFDGVQKYARIYLNGELAGEHKGGFTSFSVDVTSHVCFGEENLLSVEVSNRRDDHMHIPPMTAGNWNVYGGIYRDVRLVITERLYVPYQGSAEHEGGTFITTPRVSDEESSVQIITYVKNDFTQQVECTLRTVMVDDELNVIYELENTSNVAAGELFQFIQISKTVKNPHLWSPSSPNIYHIYSYILVNGKIVDRYVSSFGFRWFHWNFKEKRLYLNGEKIHIHGTNRHQDYPWLGDAIPKWMHEKDLTDIRFNLGHNFMRTCHYPNDTLVYDLCDRYGIIVCEEVPNIKNIDFSDKIQKQNVVEMIRRGRNHPCIVMWSMGNETNHAADGNWARSEDNSRLIHFRRVVGRGEKEPHNSDQIEMENLLRCTIRGWHILSEFPEDFPPMIENHDYHQVTGTEEWQHKMARVKDGSGRGRIDGNIVVWCYADHGADREYLKCPLKHVNPKGWVDSNRIPKYMYHLWRANYAPEPMIFIHPHFWQKKHLGEKHDIIIDSNCEEVELLVNGKSLGFRKPCKSNFHSVIFSQVLIQEGIIEAVGLKGTVRVVDSITMASSAKKILLESSHKRIVADRAGIAIVKADIVDAEGNHVICARNNIRWRVEGPGKLVGPSMFRTDYASNGSMEGTMYIETPVCIPVRSTNKPGKIVVKVSSPGLESSMISIESVQVEDEDVSGIVEPQVEDGEVTYNSDKISRSKLAPKTEEFIPTIFEDIFFSEGNTSHYRKSIDTFIRSSAKEINSDETEYKDLVEGLVKLLEKGKGKLIQDDYNFCVGYYNTLQSKKKSQIAR